MHLKKEEQELIPLFNGAFIENKPIPFPNAKGTTAYSNLFYWAHLEALETSEFPLHPHEGFEIMTFVFTGSLEHFDTVTEAWTPLKAGGMQVIQAGSGIQHAERITKGTKLFQIWFDPDFSKSMLNNASYKDYEKSSFIVEEEKGKKTTTYLKENTCVAFETRGLEISKISYEEGVYEETRDKDYTYSYYLLEGELNLNTTLLKKDAFLVENEKNEVFLKVTKKAKLFVIKSPSHIEYERFIQRYYGRS